MSLRTFEGSANVRLKGVGFRVHGEFEDFGRQCQYIGVQGLGVG